MPDCDESIYAASVSALPLRRCDSRNLDLTDLCDLGKGDIHPPIWGASVLHQYAKEAEAVGAVKIPRYITDSVASNERTYMTADQVRQISLKLCE